MSHYKKKKDLLEKKQRLGNDITNNKEFPWEIQWTASVHFGGQIILNGLGLHWLNQPLIYL